MLAQPDALFAPSLRGFNRLDPPARRPSRQQPERLVPADSRKVIWRSWAAPGIAIYRIRGIWFSFRGGGWRRCARYIVAFPGKRLSRVSKHLRIQRDGLIPSGPKLCPAQLPARDPREGRQLRTVPCEFTSGPKVSRLDVLEIGHQLRTAPGPALWPGRPGCRYVAHRWEVARPRFRGEPESA